MKRWLTLLIVYGMLLSGCGIHVVPQVVPGTSLNPDGATITAMKGGVTLSARVMDLNLGPYTGQNNITSFYVVVTNRRTTPVQLPYDSFVLLDEQKQQYRALEPSKVVTLTRREADYLIPYPYVGYYYLQDTAQYEYTAQTSSSLPYYSGTPSIDILSEALPGDAIIPGAKISGMIYFNVDLYQKQSVELRIKLPPDSTNETELVFPFQVIKN